MTNINKEGWEIVPLSQVSNVLNGYAFKSDKYVDEGVRVLRITNVQKGFIVDNDPKFYSFEDFKELSNYELFEGDLLMSLTGNVGRVGILEATMVPAALNQRVACLRIVSDKLSRKYLFHLLNSDLFEQEATASARGIAQKNMSTEWLKAYKIPLPPLPIQQRIVEELDEINAIISTKKQQLSKLDELAQSIFYNMFGDPVANEKGWEVKKLGEETTEIKYGTSSPACPNGKYKYLRMCNISYDGHLDFSDLKYIDVPDSEIEKCIVRYGDILFNRTNSLELIGKTCMFDVEEPMVIAGYIIRVRLTDKLHPRYVSVAFNLPSMKKLLRNMAKGAVNQANINSKELASINIPLPPLPLQEAFAARVAAIEEEKAAIAASIEKMQTLLDTRMQEYFG